MNRLRCFPCWPLVLGIVGTWLTGCATLPREDGLSVTVVQVLPTTTSLFETTAALTLRLTNEAAQPVSLVGGAHRLYLNGSYVGKAVSDERLTVPSLGTATQTVTVYLENLALMRKATEISQRPTISYKLESRFHAAEGQNAVNLKTATTGELDLRGLLAMRANEPGR